MPQVFLDIVTIKKIIICEFCSNSRLTKAYTSRHNAAGVEILEAIGKGQLGHCIIMSDVGLARRRSPQEAPANMQGRRFIRLGLSPICAGRDATSSRGVYSRGRNFFSGCLWVQRPP